MKDTEIKEYIDQIHSEATNGVTDCINHLQNPKLTASEYNTYAVALVKAEATVATCQRILTWMSKNH